MKPKLHGRDHRRGGADPIPLDVFVAPASLMGNVVSGARIVDLGFGAMSGPLWIPGREGPALEDNEFVQVSFYHSDPSGISHFDWLGVRLHVVEGLAADRHFPTEPWTSHPFNAARGTSTTGAGPIVVEETTWFNDDWDGYFYSAVACSNYEGDVIHFELPGVIDTDEQYSWDVPGVGHIGYVFFNVTSSNTNDLEISFTAPVGSELRSNVTRCDRANTSVTVGNVVAENDDNNSDAFLMQLTEAIPEDSGIIVVCASQGPNGSETTVAAQRPVVEPWSRRTFQSSLVPVFKVGSQTYPILRDIGGQLGAAGGSLDGGSP